MTTARPIQWLAPMCCSSSGTAQCTALANTLSEATYADHCRIQRRQRLQRQHFKHLQSVCQFMFDVGGGNDTARTTATLQGPCVIAIGTVCDGGTITFAPATFGPAGSPHVITLTLGELLINKNLTITGPGASLLTVSGNNVSRVFNIGIDPVRRSTSPG